MNLSQSIASPVLSRQYSRMNTQSMSHIINDCPIDKFEGGLAILHTASDSATECLKTLCTVYADHTQCPIDTPDSDNSYNNSGFVSIFRQLLIPLVNKVLCVRFIP